MRDVNFRVKDFTEEDIITANIIFKKLQNNIKNVAEEIEIDKIVACNRKMNLKEFETILETAIHIANKKLDSCFIPNKFSTDKEENKGKELELQPEK